MTDTHITGTDSDAPVLPSAGRLRPLGMRSSRIEDGFWADRQRLNAEAIIWHCRSWMEKAGWIGNFAKAAAGTVVGDRKGREFSDSEVYKLIEAMSWEVGRTGDSALEDDLVALIALIGSAQEPDGYLNTNFGRARPGGALRRPPVGARALRLRPSAAGGRRARPDRRSRRPAGRDRATGRRPCLP